MDSHIGIEQLENSEGTVRFGQSRHDVSKPRSSIRISSTKRQDLQRAVGLDEVPTRGD
jgi:hypothetical protein